MSMYRLFLTCLFIGYFFSPLSAQDNNLVRQFTTENGLPSNGIKGIQWDDSTGFLWIATEAGLIRFNGVDFKTFSRTNTPQMLSDRMIFLMKDRQGRIYAADVEGCLFFVKGNKLEFIRRIPTDLPYETFKMTGLAASPEMFRQTLNDPPGDMGIYYAQDQVVPLSDKRILLVRNDSLFDYRLGTKRPRGIGPVKQGSRLFLLDEKIFLFESPRNCYQLATDSCRKVRVPIAFGGGHTLSGAALLWNYGAEPVLVAAPMAWTLAYKNGQLVPRLISTAVPTDIKESFAIYKAGTGTLFFGTNSNGLILIRKGQTHPMRVHDISANHFSSYYGQLALGNGRVLTNEGDVLGGPATAVQSSPFKGKKFGNFIFTTPDSLLWYSFSDTICCYSYRSHKTEQIFAGIHCDINGFALSGGRLYVANALGIGIIQEGKLRYLYHYPPPPTNNKAPISMIEYKPGLLAVATCNGLWSFDTRTCRLDTLLRLPGICIRALWKFRDYLFIGTYGKGIWCLKDDKMKPIPLDKNGYLSFAHCFMPDKLGYCWISTNKGLFRAKPEDMIRAFENNLPRIYYHFYGRDDGMYNTELNGGCSPCALSVNDTTLSFPSMGGLVWVNPSQPVLQLPEGAIFIDEATVNEKNINLDSAGSLQLPSSTNELEFSLGFPAWVNPQNLYLEYKLEPRDTGWKPLDMTSKPVLHFSNLPSERYKLLVRKLNGFGEGNYTYKETAFRIEPNWYQRPTSRVLIACLLILGFFGALRWRTWHLHKQQRRLQRQVEEKVKELREKNEELENSDRIKSKLISIISHDLITPLKFLHISGRKLAQSNGRVSPELEREAVTEIISTSKDLHLLSTNILNWIKYRNEDRYTKPEKFSLCKLVDELLNDMEVPAKQVKLINQVDDSVELTAFIEPLKIILYNLILNGIKFTRQGYVRVSNWVTPEGVAISVEDTGIGMTSDQISKVLSSQYIISSADTDKRRGNGLGFLIIKDFLKIIKGRLSIQSRKGEGTTVTILLDT